MSDELAAQLATALEPELGTVSVENLRRLTGGASRETWVFDAATADGTYRLILRRDPPGRPGAPGAMRREARCIAAAADADLAVPDVLLVADGDDAAWGSSGMVMRHVDGETIPRRILRDDDYAAARRVLVRQCAEFLAGLHRIGPAVIDDVPADDPLDALRGKLDELAAADPTMGATPTFGHTLDWLVAHRPPSRPAVLLHGDFRLGNLIVDGSGLAAAVDWELAHAGEPGDDLGWFCVRAWRFGAELPAAGLGTREQLLDAYAAAGGRSVTPDELRWWETYNTLKWGIICLAQAWAHLSGAARSVELAAIGRRVCEQEWDLLTLVAPDATAAAAASLPRPDPTPSGHGRPTAAELLDAVGEFLRDDVVTSGDGRRSYLARVAANAVGIIGRELALGDPPPITDRRDVEQLAINVAHKLAVANPRYLPTPAAS